MAGFGFGVLGVGDGSEESEGVEPDKAEEADADISIDDVGADIDVGGEGAGFEEGAVASAGFGKASEP